MVNVFWVKFKIVFNIAEQAFKLFLVKDVILDIFHNRICALKHL